jgi:hypothetical protein
MKASPDRTTDEEFFEVLGRKKSDPSGRQECPLAAIVTVRRSVAVTGKTTGA